MYYNTKLNNFRKLYTVIFYLQWFNEYVFSYTVYNLIMYYNWQFLKFSAKQTITFFYQKTLSVKKITFIKNYHPNL